jgi:hypothetical protein
MEIETSTYYARGSVATIANSIGVPKDTISEMLGHSFGNAETEGYIERNYTWIDKAQEEIIKAIRI